MSALSSLVVSGYEDVYETLGKDLQRTWQTLIWERTCTRCGLPFYYLSNYLFLSCASVNDESYQLLYTCHHDADEKDCLLTLDHIRTNALIQVIEVFVKLQMLQPHLLKRVKELPNDKCEINLWH